MGKYIFTTDISLQGQAYNADPSVMMSQALQGIDFKKGDSIEGDWVERVDGSQSIGMVQEGTFQDIKHKIRWFGVSYGALKPADAEQPAPDKKAITINLSVILPVAGALIGIFHANSEKRGIGGLIGYAVVGGAAGYGVAALAGEALEKFITTQINKIKA